MLTIWSMACKAKFQVINSTIGLVPAIAAPTANPVNPLRLIKEISQINLLMKVKEMKVTKRKLLIFQLIIPLSVIGVSMTLELPNLSYNPLEIL